MSGRLAAPTHAFPTLPRHSLVACSDCGRVFMNWTRSGTSCRSCGGGSIRLVGKRPDGAS